MLAPVTKLEESDHRLDYRNFSFVPARDGGVFFNPQPEIVCPVELPETLALFERSMTEPFITERLVTQQICCESLRNFHIFHICRKLKLDMSHDEIPTFKYEDQVPCIHGKKYKKQEKAPVG